MGKLGLTCKCLAPIERIESHRKHGFVSYTMPLAACASGTRSLDPEAYRPKTLAFELERRGHLPVKECVAAAKRVLRALDALHGIGLVHGDVDPADVIYVKGLPVLAYDGLAAEGGAGTPAADSPARKRRASVRTPSDDLRAIALLLCRMATGKPSKRLPTQSGDTGAPGLRRLARVCRVAGDNDPGRRYVSAKAMGLALDWVLRGGEKPVRQSKSSLSAIFERLTHPPKPDTPAMARFKAFIADIAESDRLAASHQDPGQAHMTRADFAGTADRVCLAFETRIGHEPRLVRSACLLAEAVMEPGESERKRLVQEASALGGGAAGMGMVIGGVGMALGWGQGLIQSVIVLIMGGPVLWPVLLVLGGLTLGGVAAKLYFSKETPAETAARAAKALLGGVNKAIEELWDEYGELLSV